MKIKRICPVCKTTFTGTEHIRKVFCSVQCHKHRFENQQYAEESFWAKVDKSGDCWLFTGAKLRDGYGHVVRLNKHMQSHRYSWMLLRGDPGDLDVLHKCNNPPCCNPDHLYLGTDKENALDRVKAGTYTRGEMTNANKVGAADVPKIRNLRNQAGLSYKALGPMFGISPTQARAICVRKNWKHVP
jgi:hypothetical protein